MARAYKDDMNVKVVVDDIFAQSKNFAELQENVKRESKFFLHYLKGEELEEPDLTRSDLVSPMTKSDLSQTEPAQPPKEYPGKMTPIQ